VAKSTPSSPFYWNDYYRDTRVLTLDTRAIWMDMLCRAHESITRGRVTLTVDEWAQWCACGQPQILEAEAELRRHGVGNVSRKVTPRNAQSNEKSNAQSNAKSNVYITVINRRMVREEEFKKNNAMRQDKFRETHGSNSGVTPKVTPHVTQPVTPHVTRRQRGSNTVPSSSSSSSEKTKILVSPPKGDKSGDKSGTGFERLSTGLKTLFKDKLPPLEEDTLDTLREEPAT